jgi:hypothetical protein
LSLHPRFYGSNLAEGDELLRAIKISNTPSLEGNKAIGHIV